MRLFLAVNLPAELQDSVQSRLGPLQEAVRATRAQVHWVKPEQLHLTVRFFGDVPEDTLPRLNSVLAEAIAGRPSFPLALGGFGCFPARGMPHALWIGLQSGQAELAETAEAVENALGPLGFTREDRPFHAHLTVGRVRFVRDGRKLRETLEASPCPALSPLAVRSLDLMESTLGPSGPSYRCRHAYALTPR